MLNADCTGHARLDVHMRRSSEAQMNFWQQVALMSHVAAACGATRPGKAQVKGRLEEL